MLSEEHSRPSDFNRPNSDTNVYAWGSIREGGVEHNLVIASLPSGKYGSVSAATVATTMLSSFPEVRFGLMVGIGAGIPRSRRDIRLGDIVVSRPEGRSGGVVQYDFIKAMSGGELERTGFLNSPPMLLLSAVSAIKADHLGKGSKVPQFLTDMATRDQSRLGNQGYIHQGPESDQLFEAEYMHVEGNGCSNCDRKREVKRGARTSTDPEIHYGVIASGYTLVEDAAARTSLVRRTGEDCICFEMEAAGLMNHFPCLVIRGICDYADSHRNDRWQRYAAATAAAYARDLLEHVPVQDVRAAQKALDALNQSQYFASDLGLDTPDYGMFLSSLFGEAVWLTVLAFQCHFRHHLSGAQWNHQRLVRVPNNDAPFSAVGLDVESTYPIGVPGQKVRVALFSPPSGHSLAPVVHDLRSSVGEQLLQLSSGNTSWNNDLRDGRADFYPLVAPFRKGFTVWFDVVMDYNQSQVHLRRLVAGSGPLFLFVHACTLHTLFDQRMVVGIRLSG